MKTYSIAGRRKFILAWVNNSLFLGTLYTGKFHTHNSGQTLIPFRFNLAPVRGFEADVGRKTNFTTLNPSYIYG